MIYNDKDGYLVDQTLDGGDSAVRAGIIRTFSANFGKLPYHYVSLGICVRHPNKKPWQNPKNFSRDQLIPLVAGLSQDGFIPDAKNIFFKHLKRGFFCQNFERDVPGSTKYPWPHEFLKDSDPSPVTQRLSVDLLEFGFVRSDIARYAETRGHIVERKYFDFADILLPDHILHLILCAKLYPLYIFGLIGYPWLVLSILIHSRSSHKEHNQIICQCKVAGKPFIKLFKYVTPNWKQDLREYWGSRNEIEYADLIIAGIE